MDTCYYLTQFNCEVSDPGTRMRQMCDLLPDGAKILEGLRTAYFR